MKIGFIGLGAMGAPIANRILDMGYNLRVFDLDPDRVATFVSLGAVGASTPGDCAQGCDLVFAMVPDAPDSEKVVMGASGVANSMSPGTLFVDMSTIDPLTTKRLGALLAEKEISMIDCPVGRTTRHAAEGKLVLMIGGEDQDVELAMPVLEGLGDTIIRCGPLGTGTATKLVNNYMAMACNAVAAEAFVLGSCAGLTPEHMLNVFGSTMAANSQALKVYPEFALAGKFEPGFMVSLGHKDLRLALKMSEEYGCSAQVGEATYGALGMAIEAGLGKRDCSSLLMLHEQEAGTTVRLQEKAD